MWWKVVGLASLVIRDMELTIVWKEEVEFASL